MRPLALRFRAFGPYADEQELDFQLLEPHRVFLICGPTGAGKTSILDAMCFALYGETSGGERDPKRVRSDHAAPGERTEVHFSFAVGEERFAVWRTPEQERPKKRGKGTTTSPGEAAIWRLDGSGAQGEGTLLATQPRQVTETVVRLLGFHCAQFRQVIVLPQGQFRRVLTASSKDREKILEALFQTEQFRRIEEALKGEAKRALTGLQDLARRRELVLGQADADSTAALQKVRDDVAAECQLTDQRLAVLAKTVEAGDARLAELRDGLRRLQECATAEAERAELLRRREAMDAQHVELERARRAAGVADVAAMAGQRREEREAADQKLSVVRRDCERATVRHREAAVALVAEEQRAPERDAAQAELEQLEQMSTRVEMLAAAHLELNHREGERKHWADKRATIGARLAEVQENRRAAAVEEVAALDRAHRNAAARLASALQEGGPCPVCGSTEHPDPAGGNAEGEGLSDAELDALRKRSASLGALENETAAELRAAEDRARSATEHWAEQNGRVEMCQQQIPEALRNQGALRRAQNKVREKARSLQASHRVAQERIAECERALAVAQVTLQAAEQAAANAGQRDREASAVLTERLQRASFATAEEYEAARRDPEEIERLAGELREFEGLLAAAQQRVRRAQRAAADLEDREIDVEPLEAELKVARAEIDAKRRSRGVLEERLRQLDRWLVELQSVEEQTAAAERRYGVVGRLAEVAGGHNAQGVTFQRFVLAALLEEVLAEATRRLRLMSHGRFELKRARERIDLRASGGLDLEVYDAHTSTTRPVASLSGGESFLASLALALGLSDVVQQYAGGIRMETVFVDEGFGSLDSEAIDLAFRTLVDLRGDGRLVGVISHVPELEERIEARLRVRRSRRGSSAEFAV